MVREEDVKDLFLKWFTKNGGWYHPDLFFERGQY